jgi:hypothetical protein
VQNPQFSDSIIAKLTEIDASLAVQEVELTLQLQSIQEKRHSLKNVVSLFVPDTATHAPITTTTPVVAEQAESFEQEVTTPEPKEVKTEPPTEAVVAPLPKQQDKKNSGATDRKQSKKSTPTKAIPQEANTWQQYLREEFIDTSLSIAVSEVMQQHAEKLLEITTILDAIFIDEIPKEIRSTARERVSNILSVGAKKGKWYRRIAGKYSMSKTK